MEHVHIQVSYHLVDHRSRNVLALVNFSLFAPLTDEPSNLLFVRCGSLGNPWGVHVYSQAVTMSQLLKICIMSSDF